jgi:hypothetical protein
VVGWLAGKRLNSLDDGVYTLLLEFLLILNVRQKCELFNSALIYIREEMAGYSGSHVGIKAGRKFIRETGCAM